MRLRNLLGRLRVRRMPGSSRNLSNARQPARRRAVLERLEDRLLLSVNLFVDYGDAFVGGVLNTTVGAIDSTTSGSNPDIDGPRLSDSTGADYAAATPVQIQSFSSAYPGAAGAQMRAAIDELVTRFYEPLDITVVDLTTTAQTVNGHSVTAADSLDDISVTLGLNESDPKNNDTYVIVGLFTIDPGTLDAWNPADSKYGGISTGTDIGGFNNNDGTSLVMLVTGLFDSAGFLGPQVAHESGHAFGLRHTFGNNPTDPPAGSDIDGGLLESDIMSYRAYDTFGGFDFFTRYPMVKGDGNLDNDLLSAAGGALTPFDQFFIDPNIGPSDMAYVTGTGQNDIITITSAGTVTVQAFTDSAYTTAIEVPGSAVSGSVFTYTIDLAKPLLIDAGARDDRIVLDADLGTTVTLRGMHGTDDVVIMGKGAASGWYEPGTNTANGLDGHSDLRGSIVIGSTTIDFQEFESASSVTVSDIDMFTFLTPLPTDLLTLESVTAGENRVTGTSGGVTIVPMNFFNVTTLVVDTGTGSDTLTVDASGIVAMGLENLIYDAGAGDDMLILDLANYVLPDGGTFTYLGGLGTDEIRATADANFTLSDTSLGISTGGSVDLSSVESATLTGGGGENSFNVSNWTGDAILRGLGGNDAYTIDFAGAGDGTVDVDDSSGTADTLAVNGTSGTDALIIDVNSIARESEIVTHTGIDDLTVDAKDGADLITVNGTGPITTVLGGWGEDDFYVNAVGAAGVTLDGQGDSDDYTVNFGALAGTVNVADTPPDNVFDRLLVNGTSGADVLLVAPLFVTRNGTETVNYSGIEELNLDAGDGDDDITVDGTSAPTNVYGGLGDDGFTVNGVMDAPLYLDGGPGTDSLFFNGTSGDDVIILTDSSISGLGAGVTFVNIENLAIDAGAGDDIVDGSALTMSVTIFGGTGDDTLIGGSNDDMIYGEEDNDDLIGNLGNDYLDGGSGSDGLVGDKGTIVREVLDGSTAMTLTTPNGKLAEVIDEAGIRRMVTLLEEDTGGDDVLVGGEGKDYLHGGAGKDQLAGNDGDDALFGDAGDDQVSGGTGDDHLYGGAGNDLLDGNEGADIAYGGDGDDRLVADQSGDRLIDWFGNFNDFVVPGPGYGSPTIVRSPSTWVQDFLLNLAWADGSANPNAEIRIVIPGSSLQKSNSGQGGRT